MKTVEELKTALDGVDVNEIIFKSGGKQMIDVAHLVVAQLQSF